LLKKQSRQPAVTLEEVWPLLPRTRSTDRSMQSPSAEKQSTFASCSDVVRASWTVPSTEDLVSMVSLLSDVGSETTVASRSHSKAKALGPERLRHFGAGGGLKKSINGYSQSLDKEEGVTAKSAARGNVGGVALKVGAEHSAHGSLTGKWAGSQEPFLLAMTPWAVEAREVSAGIQWDDACESASMASSADVVASDNVAENEKEALWRCRIGLFLDSKDAELRDCLGRWLRPEQLQRDSWPWYQKCRGQ